MKLSCCSITGADDAVSVDDLSSLSLTYPFVEWAILLLPSMAGKNRFPTAAWIKNFSKNCAGKNRAMHLCGEALIGFVNNDRSVLDLMHGFKRIQLNLKFGNVDGMYDPQKLLNQVKTHPEWQFIIQYGRDKKGLLPLLKDIPNHAVLFDESAGRGISPDSWDAPLPGHACGYAGGLNPDNLQHNLDIISKVADGHTTWIDMETGVRTNDRFDLNKVGRVLEIAAPYCV